MFNSVPDAGWHNSDDEFVHIDYDAMVHHQNLQVKHSHTNCPSSGPKTVLAASTCRRIVEESLSLLSYHLQHGHQLQVSCLACLGTFMRLYLSRVSHELLGCTGPAHATCDLACSHICSHANKQSTLVLKVRVSFHAKRWVQHCYTMCYLLVRIQVLCKCKQHSICYFDQQRLWLQIELPGLGWVHCHIQGVYPDSDAESETGNNAESNIESELSSSLKMESRAASTNDMAAKSKVNVAHSATEQACWDNQCLTDVTSLSHQGNSNKDVKTHSQSRDAQHAVGVKPGGQFLPMLCFRHRHKGSPLKWQSVHSLVKCPSCKVNHKACRLHMHSLVTYWHLMHVVLTVFSRHTWSFSCMPCHHSCPLPNGAHQHSCFIAATACLLSASKLKHVDNIALCSLHMLPTSSMHGSAATGTMTQGHC